MKNPPLPRVRRHYSVIGHSDDVVELRYGVWNPISHTLRDESGSGTLFGIVSGLDGTATPAELAARYGVAVSDVQAVVDRLDELAVTETGPTSALDHYLQSAGSVLVRGAAGPPDPMPVTLVGEPGLTHQVAALLDAQLGPVRHVGPEDPEWAALGESGWQSDGLRFEEQLERFAGWAGRFVVHLSALIDPPRLTALNRVALGLSVPSLPPVPHRPFLLFG